MNTIAILRPSVIAAEYRRLIGRLCDARNDRERAALDLQIRMLQRLPK